jgi:hypothetical protein
MNRLLRQNFKINRIKRIVKKKKMLEEEKIKKNGTNFPVDIEKINNWKNKINKDFPFLL